MDAVVVFLGGGIGAAMRYWIAGVVYRLTGSEFPYGTLLVNVLGCFLIGLLMALFDDRFIVTPRLRLFLTIGVLGGFTTFSTFSFETMSLVHEGSYFHGAANVAYSLFACLGATWLGHVVGKLF